MHSQEVSNTWTAVFFLGRGQNLTARALAVLLRTSETCLVPLLLCCGILASSSSVFQALWNRKNNSCHPITFEECFGPCFSLLPPWPGTQCFLVHCHPESAPGQHHLWPPADRTLLQAVPGPYQPRGGCRAAHRHHEAAALQCKDDVCQDRPEPGPGSLWQVNGGHFYPASFSDPTKFSPHHPLWRDILKCMHLSLMLMQCFYQITVLFFTPPWQTVSLSFPEWIFKAGYSPATPNQKENKDSD